MEFLIISIISFIPQKRRRRRSIISIVKTCIKMKCQSDWQLTFCPKNIKQTKANLLPCPPFKHSLVVEYGPN